MATYYVNITVGSAAGTGTSATPYNKQQFSDYIRDSIVNGDEFLVKGQYEVADDTPTFLERLKAIGTATITIRGWDIATNGCPIVNWTYDDPDPLTTPWNGTNLQNNGWWVADTATGVNVVFQDFIFYSNHNFVLEASMPVCIRTYKNVLFVADVFVSNKTTPSNQSFHFYGCTFNTQSSTYYNIRNELGFYDCVFDNGTIAITNIAKLIGFNNITNIEDFISYVTLIGDISEFYPVPFFDNDIVSTPLITDFDTMVGYYTNDLLMFYNTYNVPESNNIFAQDFRIANGYNNGLFDYIRTSFGAYSFSATTEEIDDLFPTSGHVGAFYFGGDYTNADAVNGPVGLTIEPRGNATVDGYGHFDAVPITITPSTKTFATGEQSFCLDFVAKEVSDETYPKFCGTTLPCECGDCDKIYVGSTVTLIETFDRYTVSEINYDGTYDLYSGQELLKNVEPNKIVELSDYVDYSSPVAGGNALVVDFSACAYTRGDWEGYVVGNYYWYFDYENNPTEYVTCSGPYAANIYCGGYLEEFDVRLCVDFIAGPDELPPIITILGFNPTTSAVNSIYVDAGATAYDLRDGDLTDKIVSATNVNTSVVGEYYVNYTVSDLANNTANATRIVYIDYTYLGEILFHDETTDYIYDTFNDSIIHDTSVADAITRNHTNTLDCKGLLIYSSVIDMYAHSFSNWNTANMGPGVDIIIPSNITYIANQLFYQWKNWQGSVQFLGNIETIDDLSFTNWNNATSTTGFSLPSTVKTINDKAFQGWNSMTNGVTLPPNIETIGFSGFDEWKSMTNGPGVNLQLPLSLVNIDQRAFENWEAFEGGVEFDPATPITTLVTEVFGSWKSANRGPGIDIKIPALITTIGREDYDGEPNATTLIGTYTSWHSWEGSIEFLGNNVTLIGYNTFYEWRNTTMGAGNNFQIPSSVEIISGTAFTDWYSFEGIVEFSGTNLTKIGERAFEDWRVADSTSDLVIPSSVTEIGYRAFYAWKEMTGGITFGSIIPPDFLEDDNNDKFQFNEWNAQDPAGIAVTVTPLGTVPSTLSAWKLALDGTGNIASINTVPWNLIP